MKRLMCILICALLALFVAMPPRPCAGEAEAMVRIGILSKQVRLMKEGSLPAIRITLPAGTACVDMETGAPRTVRRLCIGMHDGEYRVEADGAQLPGEGALTAYRDADHDACAIDFAGQERTYPLPLELRWSPGDIGMTVQETISRYAADSALAEYGSRPANYGEALRALALVIESRALCAARHPAHGGSDVCDLTHCQVYRGRLVKSAAREEYAVRPGSVEEPPCFHARCGGETLGYGVFGGSSVAHGVRDWLSQEGVYLCRNAKDAWERTLSLNELAAILAPDRKKDAGLSIAFDENPRRITLALDGVARVYAPEDFRLRINRVRGWNFLKSNAYTVKKTGRGGAILYTFTGRGLGHGAGLCQEGALALAARGHSRFEILEHYYPGIAFDEPAASPPPGLSYVIIDMATGKTLRESHAAFRERTVPFGSLFKLAVALYLASERPDLARDFHYRCTGRPSDPAMPERCWHPSGHGDMTLRAALPRSCNLYFASLYREIDRRRFTAFCSRLFTDLGADAVIPATGDGREFSRLLAGLDFRARIPVRGTISLMRYIHGGTHAPRPGAPPVLTMSPAAHDMLRDALGDTFTEGTASGRLMPGGPEDIMDGPGEEAGKVPAPGPVAPPPGAWGKTSTVVTGTNRMMSCGIFAGGVGERGIVVLLAGGNGHLASRWAMKLLSAP